MSTRNLGYLDFIEAQWNLIGREIVQRVSLFMCFKMSRSREDDLTIFSFETRQIDKCRDYMTPLFSTNQLVIVIIF